MNNNLYYAKPDLIDHYNILSKQFGLNEADTCIKNTLNKDTIEEIVSDNINIITVSKPFLHELYNLVMGTGFFLELLDKNGVILEIIGDTDIVNLVKEYDMVVGTSMALESAGTNAISISLLENMPCQLMGEHHFLGIFKQFTCSCAPIYSENGEIIAFINLNGYESKVHKHTLALVVAAAKSIENKLLHDASIVKLEESFNIVNSILETVTDAMISCDSNGKIMSINSSGREFLGNDHPIGTSVHDYFITQSKESFLKYYKGKSFLLSNLNKRVLVDCHPNYSNNYSYGYTIIIKDIQNIIDTIEKANKNTAPTYFKDIKYVSEYMRSLVVKAKAISDSPSSVLIWGEKGVGKSLLASAIHNHSSKTIGSFFVLDISKCDISELINDNNLFSLHDATLVLDKIESINSDKQLQLLECIKKHRSSNNTGPRLISLSTENLKEKSIQGHFNFELFIELSVVNIQILPLRERRDDLKYYINIFLKQICQKQNKQLPIIKDEIYDNLMTFDYKYNIIELKKIIEKIVTLDGELEFNEEFENNKHMVKKIVNFEHDTIPIKELEKIAIINALEKYNYNYSVVAKKLGITRATLYSKVKILNETV